jgi:hypothetical protein
MVSMVVPNVAVGQTTTAILEGKVINATGAVLPRVAVEVKGGTATRTLVTDSEGHYRALALPASVYTVTVSKDGFKTKALEEVSIVLDRTVNLDIAMEVAPRSEQVEETTFVFGKVCRFSPEQFKTTFTFLCFEFSSMFVPVTKSFFSHTKFFTEKGFPLTDGQ